MRGKEQRWRTSKTIEDAVDLVNASLVLGPSEDALHAAAFIKDHSSVVPAARSAATALLEGNPPIARPKPAQPESVEERLARQIASIREKLRNQPRNSILHVELARLKSAMGQNDSALKHMRIANTVSPNHRFVLRSYTRLLVHCGRSDEAHRLLSKIDEKDPWLLAARLSTTQLIGKEPRSLRREIQIINAGLPHNQTSELAAALATVEIESGNIKRGKRFFKEASSAPNDNSVAQLRWISRECSWAFDTSLLKTPLCYEARTRHHMLNDKMKDAARECLQWLDDEPFSTNPSAIGCFIASEHLRDPQLALYFAKAGVRSNPTSAGLLNNLAFSYAFADNPEDARRHLEAAYHYAGDADKIILAATEGCILFRENRAEEGRDKYLASIRAARLASPDLVHRAIVHALAEQARVSPADAPRILDRALAWWSAQNKISAEEKTIFHQWVQPMATTFRSGNPSAHSTIDSWIDRLLESGS